MSAVPSAPAISSLTDLARHPVSGGRTTSAFFQFMEEHRAAVTEQLTAARGTAPSVVEVSRSLGSLWREQKEKEKENPGADS